MGMETDITQLNGHAAALGDDRKEKHRQKCREYYAANRERLKAKARTWRAANEERCRESQRAYRLQHGQRLRKQMQQDKARRDRHSKRQWAWRKAKMASNPSLVVYQRVMSQMYRTLRRHLSGGTVTNKSKIVQLLGCEWHEFIRHIESLFKPGMGWHNHGRSGWHFDHIRPLSSFDLTDTTQLAAGCHFTNVQPLWAADNVRKGGKLS